MGRRQEVVIVHQQAKTIGYVVLGVFLDVPNFRVVRGHIIVLILASH